MLLYAREALYPEMELDAMAMHKMEEGKVFTCVLPVVTCLSRYMYRHWKDRRWFPLVSETWNHIGVTCFTCVPPTVYLCLPVINT